MRTYLAVGLAMLALASNPNVLIIIGRDFAQTNNITVNGTTVAGTHVLPELSKVVENKDEDVSVEVRMPKSLTFTDWNNVRGLMGKIGFQNVRYFVVWGDTQKMIEIQQVGQY